MSTKLEQAIQKGKRFLENFLNQCCILNLKGAVSRQISIAFFTAFSQFGGLNMIVLNKTHLGSGA
ncbi:hypothetical protein QWZ13_19570 [Reinekea marina]|uniref:hypothetical protein n=1 Tax=Reinekea marina TaxID=1310421 RepID=UPI0025B5D39C|nr:hypothetical protein [Reinekea marina]MDN3647547.1 hypothetical protein [Reinekea marina]MDN3651116.1 hypothetical protein [Reinekea marina]